ncbi:heterokaryon incompatibility protein-domain-containing protein [Triangularia verruculosa]|uniref:Heterokaryon incompatibility protein-domain-containing protein n=1 Tax=Triangularia verruculosa TaxID=2587418 RepID=A0AAN7AQX2_9PEZI|nr:heterokaryon incompatibility protein-domain-containing protein [Triangularia verruculosa]
MSPHTSPSSAEATIMQEHHVNFENGDNHEEGVKDDARDASEREVARPETQLRNMLSEEQMASWRNTQAMAYQILLETLQSAGQTDGGSIPGVDPSAFNAISSQYLQNILASLNPTPPGIIQKPLETKDIRDTRVLATIGDNVSRALVTFLNEVILWELLGEGWQPRYMLNFYIYAVISYAGSNFYRAIGCIVLFPAIISLGGWNLIYFLLALLQPTSITFPDDPATLIPLASLVKEYTLDIELEHWLKYLTASPFIWATVFLRSFYELVRWVFPSTWLRVPILLALGAGLWYHRMYHCQSTIMQTVAHWPRPIIRETRRFMVFVLDLEATLRMCCVCLICQFKTWSLESFQYTPLETSSVEFRLLRLDALSDAPQDRYLVRCWLTSVPMGEHYSKNTYEAVSYRWGTERRNYPIVMNGKRFLVSRTVFEILRGLQYTDRGRYIWIDAICINQDPDHASSVSTPPTRGDLAEKANQVSLMGDIYHGATRVIAWVGGTANGSGALTYIKKTAARDPQAMNNFDYPRTIRELWPWTILTTWFRVIELFKRPYFRRMWMLQEVALGKTVVVKHGGEEADWDDVSPLVEFMMGSDGEPFLHEPGFWRTWYNYPSTIFGVKGAYIMNLIRQQVNRWSAEGATWPESVLKEWNEDRVRRLPLETLLGMTTDLSATNIKDKVYAVLGLTQQETRQCIKVEYDDTVLSPEELLREIARHILVSPHETVERFYLTGWGYDLFHDDLVSVGSIWSPIEVRLRSRFKRQDPVIMNLPSWVPRWTLNRFQFPALEAIGYSAGLHGQKLFEDVSGRPSCIRASLSSVDEIELLGKDFLSANDMLSHPPDFFRHIRDFVLEAKSFATKVYNDALATKEPVSEESLVEAMYRTIFCDYATGTLPPMDTSVLVQHITTCEALLDAKGFPRQADTKAYEKLGFELGRAIGGKRFCVTKGGRFGIVPPRTRVGDSIAIIWGTATPFVMRSGTRHQWLLSVEPDKQTPVTGSLEGDEHIIMGSCYVHGVMLGELRPTEHAPEMVVLR